MLGAILIGCIADFVGVDDLLDAPLHEHSFSIFSAFILANHFWRNKINFGLMTQRFCDRAFLVTTYFNMDLLEELL